MWPEAAKLPLIIGPIVALIAWIISRGDPALSIGPKRRWKILFIASWVIGMTGMVALLSLLYGYYHPVKPEPETNRIYSYNLHGTAVYLTKEENSVLHFFEVVSLAGVAGGFLAFYLIRRSGEIR